MEAVTFTAMFNYLKTLQYTDFICIYLLLVIVFNATLHHNDSRKTHGALDIFYNLGKNERLVTCNGHCVHWQFVLFHLPSLEELMAEHRHAPGDKNSHVIRVGLPQ